MEKAARGIAAQKLTITVGAAAGDGKSATAAGGKNTGTGGQAGSGSTSTQDNQKGASGGSGIVESEPDGYFIGDPFFARYVRS